MAKMRIATAALAAAVGLGPAWGVGSGWQAFAQPSAGHAQPAGVNPAQMKLAQAKAKPAQAGTPSPAAGGAVPVELGRFGDWAAYASQNAKTRICYALSQPKDRQPAALKRDPGFLFISHRPGESVRNEVSAMIGFSLKDGSDATLKIGNVVFAMTTKDDNVWIKNPAEEQRLVDAMRRGADLTITGTSRRGNQSTDRYSLSGLGQALDRVAQECK